MVMVAVIPIGLIALLTLHFRARCRRILRRQFNRRFFPAVVNANRLEFPFVIKAMELDVPIDYRPLRMQLKCDFLTLTYLLKYTCNTAQRLSPEERLLAIYFRAILLLLVIAHTLGLNETSLILKLASVLEYFTSVLGHRVNMIRSRDMPVSDYLMTSPAPSSGFQSANRSLRSSC